jgi:DNA-binding NtrC family response regulator
MKGRVLLVDDDDASRFTFAVLLEEEGFGVVEASNLADGRAQLAECACDVALIDVHLDEELGADIVPDVLAANPHAAIAFMSGDAPAPTDVGHAWIVKGGDTKKALAVVERLARDALTRAGGTP